MRLIAMILLLAGMLVGLARAGNGVMRGLLVDRDAGFSQCFPTIDNDGTTLDMEAPCNAAFNITYHCLSPPPQHYNPYVTEQVCLCSSQFFELDIGCTACILKLTGLGIDSADYASQYFSGLSSTYCDASAPATAEFSAYDETFADEFTIPIATAAPTPNLSGTGTAVSDYYTPASVTGLSAYIIPSATLTVGPSIKDGQIKPTAEANYQPPDTTGTDKPDSPSSSSQAAFTSGNMADLVSTVSLDSTIIVIVTPIPTSNVSDAAADLNVQRITLSFMVVLVGVLLLL